MNQNQTEILALPKVVTTNSISVMIYGKLYQISTKQLCFNKVKEILEHPTEKNTLNDLLRIVDTKKIAVYENPNVCTLTQNGYLIINNTVIDNIQVVELLKTMIENKIDTKPFIKLITNINNNPSSEIKKNLFKVLIEKYDDFKYTEDGLLVLLKENKYGTIYYYFSSSLYSYYPYCFVNPKDISDIVNLVTGVGFKTLNEVMQTYENKECKDFLTYTTFDMSLATNEKIIKNTFTLEDIDNFDEILQKFNKQNEKKHASSQDLSDVFLW